MSGFSLNTHLARAGPTARLHVRLPRSLTTPRGALAGRILLKGDNITLMMNATPPAA